MCTWLRVSMRECVHEQMCAFRLLSIRPSNVIPQYVIRMSLKMEATWPPSLMLPMTDGQTHSMTTDNEHRYLVKFIKWSLDYSKYL